MSAADRRARFRALHADGTFLLPNPWDVGSARLLASCGFDALATTSAGLAWSLGKLDTTVTRDELVAHVAQLAAATPLPLNVDSERCFPGDQGGVAETVRLLAEAGAAGCSIEDHDPLANRIEPVEVAAARVGEAAAVAREHGVVLTARCESHLHGGEDLDDTVERLRAYRDAGADVLYAPGLSDLRSIETLVRAVGAPVNVLALPHGPRVADLAAAGVRRVSTGGALARAAYGALLAAARELLDDGTSSYVTRDRPVDFAAAFE